MIVRNIEDVGAIRIKELQYQGKSREVKGTSVRWMVHSDLGGEEYKHNFALRYFTVDPGGSIPMHSHDYVQAGFILSGELIVTTGKEERKVGPGDVVYIYSHEPHEFRNPSQTEGATFTCIIDCPGGRATCLPPISSGD